ncbi:MAG: SulP family inorganic anion transporter [Myxococcota bacterium]
MKNEKKLFAHLGEDLVASVVVFLVALPLCMGIAIASGAPPALGLVTGMVGGLVVGMIGGAPLQVSGPAAGLTVLVWDLIQRYGLGALGVAVLIAGALQMGAGLLKLGRWFRAVSPALVQGMLAGIGVLILASQFHVMIDDKPAGSGFANLVTIPVALGKSLAPSADHHHLAAIIGVLTVATIVVWHQFRPSRLKAVPGPLVAVLVGAGAANALGWPIQYVDVPDRLWGSLNIPSPSAFSLLTDAAFLSAAVGIGIIASAETLLCATAVDRIAPESRTRYDRELFAQGVGNALCGLMGALPMTGVIVRSSANVEAGGRTKLSAILHGVWLLGLVVVFPGVLSKIPTASLAAILVYTGYRLANPAQVRQWWATGRGEALVFGVTVVGIVATDLLTGVALGFAVAMAKLLLTFTVLEVEVVEGPGARLDVSLRGAATFVRLPVLAEFLEGLPDAHEVHLHVGAVSHIDHACLDLLRDFEARYEAAGGSLQVAWDELHLRHRVAHGPDGPASRPGVGLVGAIEAAE